MPRTVALYDGMLWGQLEAMNHAAELGIDEVCEGIPPALQHLISLKDLFAEGEGWFVYTEPINPADPIPEPAPKIEAPPDDPDNPR